MKHPVFNLIPNSKCKDFKLTAFTSSHRLSHPLIDTQKRVKWQWAREYLQFYIFSLNSFFFISRLFHCSLTAISMHSFLFCFFQMSNQKVYMTMAYRERFAFLFSSRCLFIKLGILCLLWLHGHSVTPLCLQKEKTNPFPGLSSIYDLRQGNKIIAGSTLCTFLHGLKGSQQRPKENVGQASFFCRILGGTVSQLQVNTCIEREEKSFRGSNKAVFTHGVSNPLGWGFIFSLFHGAN